MPAYLVYTKILGRMIHSTVLPAAVFLLVSFAIFGGFLKTSYTKVMLLSEKSLCSLLKILKFPRPYSGREKIGKKARTKERIERESKKERQKERKREKENVKTSIKM